MGLVDGVVSAEQAPERAMQWCQEILTLPQAAMEITCKQARADLVKEFARDMGSELAEVNSWWWSRETQAALHRMVEKLAMKNKG